VSLLDPQSLGTDTPRTLDGRTYPEHLREYHRYDHLVLPLVDPRRPQTFDDLAAGLDDRNALADLPAWLASAEWRGLIERADKPSRGPRAYVLGPCGHANIPHAA
jgi:hypothetical protein